MGRAGAARQRQAVAVRAHELAETWINGNHSDVLHEISQGTKAGARRAALIVMLAGEVNRHDYDYEQLAEQLLDRGES